MGLVVIFHSLFKEFLQILCIKNEILLLNPLLESDLSIFPHKHTHTHTHTHIYIYIYMGAIPYGVVTNGLDSDIPASGFKLQLCYYIHFWTYTLRKSVNSAEVEQLIVVERK